LFLSKKYHIFYVFKNYFSGLHDDHERVTWLRSNSDTTRTNLSNFLVLVTIDQQAMPSKACKEGKCFSSADILRHFKLKQSSTSDGFSQLIKIIFPNYDHPASHVRPKRACRVRGHS
jgi:hypothetical protein